MIILTEYAHNREIKEKASSIQAILKAMGRMDGSVFSLITIDAGKKGILIIGGGCKGNFVCSYEASNGCIRSIQKNGWPKSEGNHMVTLRVGQQVGDYYIYQCIDGLGVEKVIKTFYNTGLIAEGYELIKH